ncbi:MAG: Extracellular solute-binding protein family 5 [Petrotoga mobilis]|nr:MAG: Extracellular solute-binding protein family 5 [Petrotoga mobilis]
MKKSLVVIFVSVLLVVVGFSQVAGIPREETLIANVLTGRVNSPGIYIYLPVVGEHLIKGFSS